jgi:hypothetical protein
LDSSPFATHSDKVEPGISQPSDLESLRRACLPEGFPANPDKELCTVHDHGVVVGHPGLIPCSADEQIEVLGVTTYQRGNSRGSGQIGGGRTCLKRLLAPIQILKGCFGCLIEVSLVVAE